MLRECAGGCGKLVSAAYHPHATVTCLACVMKETEHLRVPVELVNAVRATILYKCKMPRKARQAR